MSKVAVTKDKLDYLANAISAKSGESLTLTIDEMIEAVDGIEPNLQAKTYTVDGAGTATVTADSGYDGLSSVAVSVPSVADWECVLTGNYTTESGRRHWKGHSGIDIFDDGWMETGIYTDTFDFFAVAKNTTITPTESAQTIGGANYMMEGAVTVNAIPSNYVGSGIPERAFADLTISGDSVSVPYGYYADGCSARVASGTAGTPTATKGTVSNHQVSVTPSVTNTAGYISGGTINGTAVTVSASELVSGTYTVDSSGTKDVTNYASASVPSGSVTAPSTITGTSATVSTGTNTLTLSKTVSVTPSVTTAGYVTSGTAGNSSVSLTASVTTQAAQTIYPSASDQTITGSKYLTGTQTIKGVTTTNLTADNIKSGVTVQIGDSADSDRVASVTGTYTGGGTSKNVQVVQGTTRTTSSTMTAIGAEMTVSKTGTYDVYWSAFRSNTSSQYTFATQLYVGGTAYGSEQTTWSNHQQNVHLSNVSLTVNQKIRVYGRESRGSSYYMYAGTLTIVEA